MAAKKDKADDKKEEEKKEDGKDKGKEGTEGGEKKEGAEGEAAPAEGGEAPKKSKKKLIMIAGGVVVLLIAVGAGLYFMGFLDSLLGKKEEHVECAEDDEECKAKAAEHGEEGAEGEHGEGAEHTEGAFLPIPTMIVNLSSEEGVPRYLRLTVQLELKSQEDLHAVEAVIPRVIDQFQTYLRELRVKDLRGSAGIYRLQMELLWRVNQAAAPVEVKDVLFQEILIQ